MRSFVRARSQTHAKHDATTATPGACSRAEMAHRHIDDDGAARSTQDVNIDYYASECFSGHCRCGCRPEAAHCRRFRRVCIVCLASTLAGTININRFAVINTHTHAHAHLSGDEQQTYARNTKKQTQTAQTFAKSAGKFLNRFHTA